MCFVPIRCRSFLTALPPDTSYVTHDNGYCGSVPRPWLLTQCRHHIMTNSSYYWWGAWLSRGVHGGTNQTVFAADNFINTDSYPPEWEQF